MRWLFVAVVALLLHTTCANGDCTQQFAVQEGGKRFFTIDVPTGDVAVPVGGFFVSKTDDNAQLLVYSDKVVVYSTGNTIFGDASNTIDVTSNTTTIVAGVNNVVWKNASSSMILGGSDNVISNNNESTIVASSFTNLNNTAAEGNVNTFVAAGNKVNMYSGPNTRSAIIGGINHYSSSTDSAILGGYLHQSNVANSSVFAGGYMNTLDGSSNFLGGGANLIVSVRSESSSVVGGYYGAIGSNVGAFCGGGDNAQVNANLSASVGGNQNNVEESYSFIGGGLQVSTSDTNSAIIGGSQMNIGVGANCSFIGGGSNDYVDGTDSAIIGGSGNNLSPSGLIAGGFNNSIDSQLDALPGTTAILGGQNHKVTAALAFVGGGSTSLIDVTGGEAPSSAILGGFGHLIGDGVDFCDDAFIAGGLQNYACFCAAAIGGKSNVAFYNDNFVGGGSSSVTGSLPQAERVWDSGVVGGLGLSGAATSGFIGGGSGCGTAVFGAANQNAPAILGGNENQIISLNGFVGGGDTNTVYSVNNAAIIGGVNNSISTEDNVADGWYPDDGDNAGIIAGASNFVQSSLSVVVGGTSNNVTNQESGPSSENAVVGGDHNRLNGHATTTVAIGCEALDISSGDAFYAGSSSSGTQELEGSSCAVLGTADGNVTRDSYMGALAGGVNNSVSSNVSAVFGGANNSVSALGGFTAGTGGVTVQGGADYTAVVGGVDHSVLSGSEAHFIGGGASHSASAGSFSAILGGHNSTVLGNSSVAFGESVRIDAVNNTFAAGSYAYGSTSGTFVWADASKRVFTATSDQMFAVQATGGVKFVYGYNSSGEIAATLDGTASSWSFTSDRAQKRDITTVNYLEALATLTSEVPISTYTYIVDPQQVPHMGPMAQDLYAAFGLGTDEKRIATQDADGAALAAIHGLHHSAQSMSTRVAQLADDVRSHEEAIGHLQEKVNVQNGRNNELKVKVQAQALVNDRLAETINTQQASILQLQTLLDSLFKKLDMQTM